MKTAGTDSAAGKPPRGRLRIAGIQWPDSISGIDPQAALAALADATTLDELGSVGSKHAVTVPFPVYQDELGQFFSMQAGVDNSLVATALNLGPLHDLQDGAPGPGSFLKSSTLSAAATRLNAPSVSAAIAAAAAHMILSSQGASPQGGGSAAKADNPLLDKLKSFFESAAEQKAASVVANYVMGNSLTQGLIQSSIGGMAMSALDAGINEAIDFAESEALSKLFPTSDTSNAGQFLAAEAAKELLDKLKSMLESKLADMMRLGGDTDPDSLRDKLNYVLGSPRAGIALARLGDPTSHKGAIDTGAAMTEVGGMPVARLGDHQNCPIPGPPPDTGGPIIQGNPTIEIEGIGKSAAGYGHNAQCTNSGAVTFLMPAKDDVEIGMVTDPVAKPPIKSPSGLKGALAAAASSAASNSSSSNSPPPTSSAPSKPSDNDDSITGGQCNVAGGEYQSTMGPGGSNPDASLSDDHPAQNSSLGNAMQGETSDDTPNTQPVSTPATCSPPRDWPTLLMATGYGIFNGINDNLANPDNPASPYYEAKRLYDLQVEAGDIDPTVTKFTAPPAFHVDIDPDISALSFCPSDQLITQLSNQVATAVALQNTIAQNDAAISDLQNYAEAHGFDETVRDEFLASAAQLQNTNSQLQQQLTSATQRASKISDVLRFRTTI